MSAPLFKQARRTISKSADDISGYASVSGVRRMFSSAAAPDLKSYDLARLQSEFQKLDPMNTGEVGAQPRGSCKFGFSSFLRTCRSTGLNNSVLSSAFFEDPRLLLRFLLKNWRNFFKPPTLSFRPRTLRTSLQPLMKITVGQYLTQRSHPMIFPFRFCIYLSL